MVYKTKKQDSSLALAPSPGNLLLFHLTRTSVYIPGEILIHEFCLHAFALVVFFLVINLQGMQWHISVSVV